MKSPVYHINRSLSLKLCLGILLCVVVVFTISLGFLFERSRRMVRQEAVAHSSHSGPERSLVQSFTSRSGSTYCVLSTVPGIGDTVNKKRILF